MLTEPTPDPRIANYLADPNTTLLAAMYYAHGEEVIDNLLNDYFMDIDEWNQQ